MPAGKRPAAKHQPKGLSVLYEDDAVIVIEKPCGLLTMGTDRDKSRTVHAILNDYVRRGNPRSRNRVYIVHRLDRDTSGILLVAKKRAALVALHGALRAGQIDKRYLVMVRGKWRDAKRQVDLPLTKFLTGEGERRVRVERTAGQVARTVFYRRQTWPHAEPPLSLLEAELHTGRTHQIRVHLTHLGFPLAGDDKYGDFAWNKLLARQGLKRMFLHAWRLSLAYPVEARKIAFEAPLPPDLEKFVARLSLSDSGDA
jgi:23S rRNA pseudouridine955/2504/2580 synthase